MTDWTVDHAGRANSSSTYLDIVNEVERIIRGDAHALINGRADSTARRIVSQLAHRHGFGPGRPSRVLAPGQWLGTNNRIISVSRTTKGWKIMDSTGSEYTPAQHPDGLKTWDFPNPGGDPAPKTPWPTELR